MLDSVAAQLQTLTGMPAGPERDAALAQLERGEVRQGLE